MTLRLLLLFVLGDNYWVRGTGFYLYVFFVEVCIYFSINNATEGIKEGNRIVHFTATSILWLFFSICGMIHCKINGRVNLVHFIEQYVKFFCGAIKTRRGSPVDRRPSTAEPLHYAKKDAFILSTWIACQGKALGEK